jgi:hypothetical protein
VKQTERATIRADGAPAVLSGLCSMQIAKELARAVACDSVSTLSTALPRQPKARKFPLKNSLDQHKSQHKPLQAR